MRYVFKALRGLLYLIIILAIVVAGVGWYLSSPVSPHFVERFNTLPYYKDGAFFNQEKQADYEFKLEEITH